MTGGPGPGTVAAAQAAHTPLEPPPCDDRAIWDVWLSRWHLPAVTVADELGLFGLLDDGPQSREGIRARLGVGARGAEALTGVLAALGFLAQRGGRYALTDVARTYLVPGRPYYWGPMLHRSHRARLPQGHSGLLGALRRDFETASLVTGSAADEARSSVEAWARGEIDPQLARSVTSAMHSQSFPAAFGVARRGDFAGVRRLLDVAGGSGCVCIALALRLPALRCTVLELAPVVEDVAEEVSVVAGRPRVGEHVRRVGVHQVGHTILGGVALGHLTHRGELQHGAAQGRQAQRQRDADAA